MLNGLLEENIEFEFNYKQKEINSKIPYRSFEDINIFQLVYKSYEKKNEREKKLEKVKNFINFFGDNEKDSSKIVKIFGKKFLNKNKNKCKIAYKNKKYELR